MEGLLHTATQHLEENRLLDRRVFLAAIFTFVEVAIWNIARTSDAGAEPPSSEKGKNKSKQVTIVEFTNTGERKGSTMVDKIAKTEAEWKKQLTAEEFEVTRLKGTERAFTGRYWDLHDQGIYRCVCCGNALFSSETKFDSGTGWPSFWAPIAKENVRTQSDWSLGMPRTEAQCRECDAHLGHVFDDGPAPTHLRYCLNSAALRFEKKSS